MTAAPPVTPQAQLEAIRTKLACGQPGCTCIRGNTHCPAHDDRTPSLSLSIQNGTLLFKCHGGCSQDAVIDALRERGLWQERRARDPGARPATFKTEPIACWYDYHAADGALRYIVGRTPSKQFPVFHANGNGWTAGYGGPRILYRLPELIGADTAQPVLILEGEKDADRAWAEGFIATTTPGGAGKAHLCDLTQLKGRHVVAIPDKDEPGRKHADDLVRLVGAQRMDLPDIARKDLSDYFDAGGTAGDLEAHMPHRTETLEAGDRDPHAESKIDWPEFWRRERREEDFLIAPLLPRRRSVAIYSPAGGGKSELSLYLAARLATGQRVLDQPAGEPLNVVYLDLEMTEDDLYDRLTDMGFGPETDLSRLHYYLLPSLPPLDTPDGGAAVLAIVMEHEASLLVIDTTARVISGKENDADTLRAFFLHTGLRLKAEGVTYLRLDHAGKDLTQGQRGTSAKNDDVDIVWELTQRAGGSRLKAQKRRQSWIPEVVDLVRLEDPLRYERAMESWPPGTYELSALLDRLNIPLDFGARKVRPLVREDGWKGRNEWLAAAIRYRKQAAETSGTPSGTPSETRTGTPHGDTQALRYGDTPGDTPGHPRGASGDVTPSIDGDTPAGTDLRECQGCGKPVEGADLCEDCEGPF